MGHEDHVVGWLEDNLEGTVHTRRPVMCSEYVNALETALRAVAADKNLVDEIKKTYGVTVPLGFTWHNAATEAAKEIGEAVDKLTKTFTAAPETTASEVVDQIHARNLRVARLWKQSGYHPAGWDIDWYGDYEGIELKNEYGTTRISKEDL